MKKIFLILTLLPCLCFGQANESMDSITLATYMHNVDSIKQSNFFTHDINRQVINSILSLNKRVTPGSGTGLTSLNSQTGASQSFATGTAGTDFGISSSGNVHTFNIPDASASNRGLITTGTQTIAGTKTFSTGPTFTTAPTFSSMASGQVFFAGTSGVLAAGTNNLFYNSANQELISNAGTIGGPALLLRRDLTSTNQFLQMNNTTDVVKNGFFRFTDAISAGFSPRFQMYADTTVTDMNAIIEAGGFQDQGTVAAFQFRVSNGPGTGVLSTKPLYTWQNFTTVLMNLNKDGIAFPDGILTTSGNSSDSALLRNGTNGKVYLAPVVTASNTITLTNKRITPRVTSVASSSTPAPSATTDDIYELTALATDPTFSSPGAGNDGQQLVIRIKDNGTPRNITWNAIYRSGDIALPSSTITSKTLYCQFMYNSADSKWDFVSSIGNF